ncbi:MAG: ATP-binding cassette domain-containing protein [Deltaproteobacteria bacterium]|nr:ATP-binding cassette domain-containing protein [Deltaproteobacteria bacterium]
MRCVGLTKRFGEHTVLDGIDLVCHEGETNVIIGGSGAGKTTLLRLLIGLEKPTSGRVEIEGEDIGPLDEFELNRVRRKFGMVFQYAALLDSLTILDNVAFPLREHTSKGEKEIRRLVLDKLEKLGLGERVLDLFPAELSGGMRKRVGLARALMLDPKIIVYDEPTSGLDPLTTRTVDEMIEQARDIFGVTNVVISHDMSSTFRIAHRVHVLVKGRIVASGSPREVVNSERQDVREFIEASGVDLTPFRGG